MYYAEIKLTRNIANIFGYSKFVMKRAKELVKKEIDEYCGVHKLKKSQIDWDVEYQVVITIKKKSVEHEDQITLDDFCG